MLEDPRVQDQNGPYSGDATDPTGARSGDGRTFRGGGRYGGDQYVRAAKAGYIARSA